MPSVALLLALLVDFVEAFFGGASSVFVARRRGVSLVFAEAASAAAATALAWAMLKRFRRRDLLRAAALGWMTPFCAARSRPLIASRTASSAVVTSAPMKVIAFPTRVLVLLLIERFLCRRLID